VRTNRAKSEKGEAVGRCKPNCKKRKKPHLGCIVTGCLAAKPPLLFFLRPRQAITANTGRRLELVIIGESDKPISLGAIAGIPRSLIVDLERRVVSAADVASPRELLYITPSLKRKS